MKKLFTFLSRANNNSVGISFNHRRVSFIYSMLTIVAVLLMVPSVMKGQTTIDFVNAALGAHFRDAGNSGYYADFVMGDDFSAIGDGAKKGVRIDYKYGNTGSLDISQLAFAINANGKGNARNEGAGFYLRREKYRVNGVDISISGLFTGSWNNKIAVLDLKPGDKVTFYASASNEPNTTQNLGIKYCKDYDSNVWAHVNGGQNMKFANGDQYPNTNTIYIDSPGDLVVQPNKDVYITKIVIENGPRAEYEITTDNTTNTTTFQFTADGSLDINDYTIPSMQASFGNANDYLMVSGLKAEMHKIPSWSETLETGGHNYQPSAGSFYEFKPTAGGKIEVDGSLTGRVHLFVYDPTQGIDTWVQKQNNYVFYKLNFPDTNNGNPQPGSEYYDKNYNFTDKGNGNVSFSFSVEKNKYYYICIDNTNNEEKQGNYAFHLHSFSFTPTFHIPQYAKIVDLDKVEGDIISLVKVEGAESAHVKVKRVSGNFTDMYLASLTSLQIDQFGWLSIPKPVFKEGTDNAGTIIFTIDSPNGDATFVVTFPYHASYDVTGDGKDPYRTYGHTWNFIDPRNSDSNIGNCREWNNYNAFIPVGTTTGILSIGRDVDTNSTFHYEVLNREWTYSQRQTGSSGGFHDPYYANVWEMEGDNADMIWETEGLWFDTGTNLSCIHNENDAVDQSLTNPLDFKSPGETDPDRYVGLMPVTDGKKSSFTIPGLMPGDRVLIFMKSGEGSGDNGIFLNITGAKDALGKQILATDLYKAGGTNWQHSRYEGCYHFIKDDTTDEGSEYGRITFDMKAGSMCKLLYIHIYQGQRINTNSIVSSATGDSGRLLFMNEKGAELGSDGQGSNMTLRFRGKGQQQKAKVLTCSGNLNYQLSIGKNHKQDVLDDHFTVTGAYYQSVGFTSKVGEIGMFRLREMDVEYSENYVADFSDRNFTVGYRDKVDSYPYTWDFTDIKGFSQAALTNEANNYPIAAAANDEYGDQWEISLFDSNGYMQLNSGFDPITNNQIFSPHKIGNGNQLWAGAGVIPEAKGLWFYSEDDEDDGYTTDYCSSLYNGCMQITTEGIRFANVPDDAGKRVAWWNYKMVVPDVPKDGAVYMRMKRDTSVPDDAVTYSEKDNADVPFLAARFKFASQTSKTDMVTGGEIMNGSNYSFFKVPNTSDEWIVAVKNTTGAVNHLTFTLNGWIVEKVAVSTDPKAVNTKGWTSESRNHAIDATLTAYLTGKDMKTYFVGQPNYNDRTLVLTDVGSSEDKHVMPANTGCVIFNATDENKAIILNDGFHLFVPDMHDTEKLANAAATINNAKVNMLKPQLAEKNPMQRTESVDNIEHTVYVLSYKFYQLDGNGNANNSTAVEGPEMFYRIAADKSIGLRANSAYLLLPTGEVKPQGASGAKYSFIFADYDDLVFDSFGGIATGVETIEAAHQAQEGWYTINGQKLSGRPTTSGLYIVNGKKVLVK